MAGVSIQEAARALGVAQDTIRRRIRRGELQAHQEPTPQGFRWVVVLEPSSSDAISSSRCSTSQPRRSSTVIPGIHG